MVACSKEQAWGSDMALKRSVAETMVRWHADPSCKAPLVTGVRQVGKTFAIREFMQAHYETVRSR